MSEYNYFKFTNSVLLAPLLAVLAIWTIYWFELRLGTNFNEYGVYPQTLTGLRGVILSPFIHGSLEHLYNNTIPLAVLTAVLFYFYRKSAITVLILGILISGLITWAIGRPSYHIGASGLIYVLVSFIFFKGILTKYYRLIALSLLVVFIYGSMLWYVFPVKAGISWEGHLGGFLTGLFLAFVIKTKLPIPKKFPWEHPDYNEEADEFLQHFDENGNFVEKVLEDIEEGDEPLRVSYHFKKDTTKPEE